MHAEHEYDEAVDVDEVDARSCTRVVNARTHGRMHMGMKQLLFIHIVHKRDPKILREPQKVYNNTGL